MDYVRKKLLTEYKKLFGEAVKYVRTQVPYNFYHRLIGSAKRNLVLEHHNKGIDFDYQIIFNQSFKGEDYQQIKDDFLEAFKEFFVERGYEYAEDSMSAITIKKLNNGKIHHSYDITILSPEPDVLHIIRYETQQKEIMILKPMKKTYKFRERYKKISGTEMWGSLRDIYKYKKTLNVGSEEKKSFSLLAEATKEVLDKYHINYE